jgi:hypothetical protein
MPAQMGNTISNFNKIHLTSFETTDSNEHCRRGLSVKQRNRARQLMRNIVWLNSQTGIGRALAFKCGHARHCLHSRSVLSALFTVSASTSVPRVRAIIVIRTHWSEQIAADSYSGLLFHPAASDAACGFHFNNPPFESRLPHATVDSPAVPARVWPSISCGLPPRLHVWPIDRQPLARAMLSDFESSCGPPGHPITSPRLLTTQVRSGQDSHGGSDHLPTCD